MWAWHLYIIMPGTSFSLSRATYPATGMELELAANKGSSLHGLGCFSLSPQEGREKRQREREGESRGSERK